MYGIYNRFFVTLNLSNRSLKHAHRKVKECSDPFKPPSKDFLSGAKKRAEPRLDEPGICMSKVTSLTPALYMHQGQKADIVECHECLGTGLVGIANSSLEPSQIVAQVPLRRPVSREVPNGARHIS